MTKLNQNVENYYSGDSLILDVTVVDELGASLDITGASAEWGLFNSAGTRVVTKTTGGGGITITDAANGELEVAINPADTASLEGTYDHELEVTDSSGNVSTVLVGSIEILEDQVV